jgi:nucleotidyltransferase/DNA polymerase involved in DNA repair
VRVILAHLDLDAFYAAVEELEEPSLRRKPLVVGGDPHGRGVVATANYAARQFGIRSAMSCAEALRLLILLDREETRSSDLSWQVWRFVDDAHHRSRQCQRGPKAKIADNEHRHRRTSQRLVGVFSLRGHSGNNSDEGLLRNDKGWASPGDHRR